MFANERQDIIYKMVKENGSVSTSQLVEHFGVSIETIRRDLLSMEQNKMLYRVHGGAVRMGEMKTFDNLSERVNLNNDSKLQLCRTAMDFISDGDVIAVDAGSTAILFAEALKERFTTMTVVTHCLDVFNMLCRFKDFNVILCGGHFIKNENAFSGPITIAAMELLHVQKVFLFPAALSLKSGICDHCLESFLIQQQLLKMGDSVHILADSSKFGCKELLKLDDMRQNYTYISDSGLSASIKKMYEENGLRIITGVEDIKNEYEC